MAKRATHSRLRKKVKFLGVENGLVPLLASGGLSLALCVLQSNQSLEGIAQNLLPFGATYAVMRLLFTGKRPHFASDALASLLPGARCRTAFRPGLYPRHPFLTPTARGTRAPHAQP